MEVNNLLPSAGCEDGESWAARTTRGFEFSLKLFQDFTHKRDGRKKDVDVFKRGTEPLADAGKLGALLCPFPASFKRDDASVEYLVSLLKTFNDYRAAVELGPRSWSDGFGETIELLQAMVAGYTEAVKKFREHAQDIPQVELMLLLELAERARLRCEAVHRLLDRHIEEHGC